MQLQFPVDLPVPYETRVTRLFGIGYPIIQAGMVWTSGHRLASAAANAGALGLIGAGSMKPELLAEHIRACRAETSRPFGVNIPLIRGDVERLIATTLEEGVRIVFTSAGNPSLHIDKFKSAGVTVVHVVASVRHARKAESVGVDAVVAEGFEAGGHNGLDEITTLCLVPQVVDAVSIPVIAAGGIGDGRGMAAALALGAEAVQVGTRFAATHEASAHPAYKHAVVEAADTATVLTLKKVTPVRLIRNAFAERALEAESSGADAAELRALLGAKRERMGIFEGDVAEGELEAGQVAGMIDEILSAGQVVERMIAGFDRAVARLGAIAAPAGRPVAGRTTDGDR
jgi:enoyl-[acyl-carrier protein] reductase II